MNSMLIEILIATTLGIFAGTITGLTPGLHINLVNIGIISFVPIFPQSLSTLSLCVFILSMSVTHTFVDAIPSIYLGAPDADHALSVLPGHRLLLDGKGHLAILFTVIGSLGSLIISILLLPVFIIVIITISDTIKPYIGYALILIMIYLISHEKNKLMSTTFFLLSGALGLLVFLTPHLYQPLFAMLSGLFGISILIPSLTSVSAFPVQDHTIVIPLSKKAQGKAIGMASFMGFVAAFLPGFGSSQAAIIASKFTSSDSFLILTGGINTASMVLSLATAYAISKARNGSIISILALIPSITTKTLILFAFVALLVGSLAALNTMFISKKISNIISKLPYKLITSIIIIAIIIASFAFDSWIGLFLLAISTLIGLSAGYFGIGKNYLVGCLLVPVIFYFI